MYKVPILIIIMVILLSQICYSATEVYYPYSFTFNGNEYIINIGYDLVEVYSVNGLGTPLYSTQLDDPRKCDYDDENNILYVGCGRGKRIYKLTFPELDYIDHLEMDYEVWSVRVVETLGQLYVGLSEWPDTNEPWHMLEALIDKGWVKRISLSDFEVVNDKNVSTIPRDIMYSENYNKLYVSCHEWIYSIEAGITKGTGYQILILDPDTLEVIGDIYTPDLGLNITEGPAGYIYNASISRYYHFESEYLDGVGLIEYELDTNGELEEYHLIDIGSTETTDARYNPVRGEVYILVYGDEPDFVIYDISTGEYEAIEFASTYISHFCIGSDWQTLYFASPEANAILVYELE